MINVDVSWMFGAIGFIKIKSKLTELGTITNTNSETHSTNAAS